VTSKPIRGVWVTNIDSEILFSDDAIAEGLKKLADRGFNTIYPVVWNDGYTLHPSQVMADRFGEEFRQDTLFRQQGRDPLKVVILEARKQGLRVIPWFEFGFSSSYSQDGGHILQEYPEWAAKDPSGSILKKNGFEWMNAIHPEVQAFVTDLVLEVARNYDIDGIQGDDRLPAMPSEGGYSEYTRDLFQKETGQKVPEDPRDAEFLQWKSDKLSDYAVDLYNSVKELNPELIVSFAPSIYPWSKEEYLQDWPEWLRRGVVDELIPQAYRWTADAYKITASEMVDTFNTNQNGNVAFASGVIIKAGSRYNDYTYVKEILSTNRSLGIDGEVYFFYEGLFEQNGNLADSLFQHHYRPAE
jgi:uncharacterized lipoprotein YddW (UPF0748 family)